MKKLILTLVAAAAIGALVAGFALAQEKGKASEQPMFSPEEMAAWQKASTPGLHHKHLAELAGAWKAVCTMWMKPGAEPETAEIKVVCESLFGGRYLLEKSEGMMMGMPFEGMSLNGYDNLKGKHTTAWIDNMGTGTMYAEGTCSDSCTVNTQYAVQTDPMTGKDAKVKMVNRTIDKNTRVFEYYMVGDDGSEFKTMEITYTRM